MAPPGRLCAGRTGLVGEYGRRALRRLDRGPYLRQRPGLCRADEGVADCTAVDRGATPARTRPRADDASKGAVARRADRSNLLLAINARAHARESAAAVP